MTYGGDGMYRSRDRGKTFGPPLKVAPPGLREAWGPALDVDAKGRVAMAYMGSTDSPGAPWTGSYGDTTFTGYLARFIMGGGDGSPSSRGPRRPRPRAVTRRAAPPIGSRSATVSRG